jgi:hypothetical protein
MSLTTAPFRVLAAAAACALLSATPASASPADEFPAGGPSMNQAWDQAVGYWQGMPCHGQVRLAWATMGKEYNAIARWTATDPARPETFTNCSITFNTAQPYDYPMLCSIMTHEIGHLLGQPHGGDRQGSVMSETYYGPVGPCGPAALPEPPPESASVDDESSTRPTSAASKRRRARCVKRMRAKRLSARAAQKRCTPKRSTTLR